ncbi:hypothetical protein UCDDS831_g03204 [Diplodia seriata]|uniref:Uncharacterized protein n=1 Tax=Diplodia seriata TaxID=420778 RepID=A0A0G2EL49_9PEZI|nr:hypothetical protein UCDDS831_g03204 [Diplodia seriata]
MAPKNPVLSYRKALLAETKPFPLPSVPSREKESKAIFVLTAQEDKIRENIRYRIYDFCFDLVYDEAPKSSIMQYIRVLDLPPHRFFNRGHWENTMVHGHWSHEPRGLALLRVCKSIYHEVFFRFYWFHVPNLILSDGDIQVEISL